MSRTRWIPLAVIALLVAGAVAAYILRRQSLPADVADAPPESAVAVELPQPPPLTTDYVGSSACATCHPKIAEAYRTHSMSRSMASVEAASPLEDYGSVATFSPDGQHQYRVEKTDGGILHHERFADSQGEPLYDQAVRVDYAMGSGVHGRSYLIDRGGTMTMSPITWYSGAKRWNLSPGYSLPVHPRFDRQIKDGCLDCHVGRVNAVRGHDQHVANPPFLELSIGCERCHGPGGEHVKFHQSAPAGGVAGKADPIINPAKLEPARREDVCAQCHLQGHGRIPHYGTEVGDYRPGQRLEETCVIFVEGTRTSAEGTRAVSQVEQMRASTCFQQSQGKFGCISCHDPHSLPAEEEKVTFYRLKCLECHTDRGCKLPESKRQAPPANDSCMHCHMPKLGASDVPHTAQTDHRVLRKPGVEHTPPGRGLPEIFDHADKRLPELTVQRARGIWLAEQGEAQSNPRFAMEATRLLAVVVEHLPRDADTLEALGTAAAMEGRFEDSLTWWKRALEVEPNRESVLRPTAMILMNSARSAEALTYLERFLKEQPDNASMWGRCSQLLGQAQRWREAIAAGKKAESLDPSQARIYQWLSHACGQAGDEAQSRHYQALHERMRAAGRR